MVARTALASCAAIALGLAGCHGPGAASPATFAGDPGHGRSLVVRICAACHGLDGSSISHNTPNLGGQYPEYIAKQLKALAAPAGSKTARLSPIMGPIAAGLSENDINDVAAYYASQSSNPRRPRDPQTLELGRKVFTEGNPEEDLPACITCHRSNGQGIRPDFPRVGGQNPDYVDAQLEHWLANRGHRGKLMSIIAPRLSAEERAAVADYIAQLDPSKSGP